MAITRSENFLHFGCAIYDDLGHSQTPWHLKVSGHFLGPEVTFYKVLDGFFWAEDFAKIHRALVCTEHIFYLFHQHTFCKGSFQIKSQLFNQNLLRFLLAFLVQQMHSKGCLMHFFNQIKGCDILRLGRKGNRPHNNVREWQRREKHFFSVIGKCYLKMKTFFSWHCSLNKRKKTGWIVASPLWTLSGRENSTKDEAPFFISLKTLSHSAASHMHSACHHC